MMKLKAKMVLLGILAAGLSFAAEPNEKAGRFLSVLEQRPFAESLFDRFFDAWLESATIEECEVFLKSRADRSPQNKAILARFYLRRGLLEDAEATLKSVVEGESAPPEIRAEAWIQLAQIAGLSRNFVDGLTNLDKAEAAFKEANLWNVKSETDVIQHRGKFLIRLGKRDDALEVWEEFLMKRPDDDVLREDLVMLLANEGIWDKAIEQQQILIDRSGDDAYQQVLRSIALGQLFRRSSRWDDALGIWRSTLPKTGHDTWIEQELIGLIATVFRQKGNLTAWKEELNKLIETEPKRLALRIEKAGLLADLREDAPAIEAWEEILALTPGNREVRLQFARTLSQLGRSAEAATQLGRLVKLTPDDAELRFELAGLHFAAKNLEDTRKQITAYLDKSDGTEFSILRAARQFDRFEMEADAETVFEQLVARFPDSASASEAFATFLYDTGKKERAVLRWNAIGKTGDVTQLLRAANQLVNRSEAGTAFEMLHGRLEEFPEDRGVLELLCELALATDREAEAIPWARRLVEGAETGSSLGQAITLAGQIAKAADRVSGLIEELQATDSVKQKCLLADLVRLSGDTERSLELLEEAAASEAGKADAEYPLAISAGILRKDDSFAKAAEVMERILALPGGHTTANLQLVVRDHKKAKAPEAALKWVAEWRKIAPGNKLPWIEASELLRDQGRISESLDMLRGASRRFEKDASVQTKLADAYVLAGFPLEAERTLWKLYESTGDEWKQRGLIDEIMTLASQAGRKDQIVERFELRHRNNSQAVGPLLALASVYRMVNRKDDQREALLKAGRIEPNNILLSHQIAALDEKEGRIESAIRTLEAARKRDKTPRTTEILARLHLQLGQLNEAIAIYEAMPDGGRYATPENIIGMGKALMMFGEWDLVVKFLEPKLALHADNGAIHYLHALALLEGGRNELAAKAFERLLSFKMNPAANAAANQTPNRGGISVSGSNRLALRTPVLRHIDLIEALRDATLYRVNSGDGKIWAFPVNRDWRASQGNIQLPKDETSLRNYALTHLISLADTGSYDLTGLGEYSEWELEFVRSGASRTEDFLKRWIDTPEVALLWIGNWINSPQTNKNQSLFTQLNDRAFAAVAKTYDREIQFFAADALRSRDAAGSEKWIQAMVECAEKVEAPGPVMMRTIAFGCFSRLYSGSAQADGTTEIIDVEKRALKLLAEYDVPSPPVDRVLPAVVQALMCFGEPESWVGKVKAEQQRYLKNHQGGFFSAARYNSNQQIRYFNGVSPQILQVSVSGPFWQSRAKAGVVAALDAMKEPEYRLVRIYFSQVDSERFDAEMAALLADFNSGKSLSAPLLVALASLVSPDEPNEKRLEAIEILLTARDTNDATPEMRHLIDGKIVKLAAQSEIGADVRKQGVDAAWRFLEAKQISLNNEFWEVPELLRQWGQPAEKIDRASRAFQALYQRTYSQIAGSQGQRAPQSVQHAVTLGQMLDLTQLHRRLSADRSKANAALVAARLRMYAPGMLMMAPGTFEQQYDHFTEQLQQGDLVEYALDSVRPDPVEARALDRVRFVCLQDLLGKKSEALEGYDALIAEFPEDDGLRRRRIEVLAKIHPEQLIDELKRFAENERTEESQVNHVLGQLATLNFPKMKTRLDVAEQLIAFVERDEGNSVQPQWFGHIQNNLNQSFREEKGVEYGGIVGGNSRDPFGGGSGGSVKAPEDPAKRAIYDRNDARRRELFVKICERGLSSPVHAAQSFRNLAILSAKGVVPEKEVPGYVESAIQAILRLPETGARSFPLWGNATAPSRGFASNGNSNRTPATPESAAAPLPWLIEYAFRTNQQGLITELTLFDRDDPSRVTIDAIANLYFCEPQNFDEAVKHSLAVSRRSPASINYVQRVLSLRPEVEKVFNSEPLILALLEDASDSSALNLAALRVSEVAISGDLKKAKEFLDQVIEAATRNQMEGARNPQITGVLNNVGNAPGGLKLALEVARERGLQNDIRVNVQPLYYIERERINDPEVIFIQLRNAGLLDDIDRFDILLTADFKNLRGSIRESSLATHWIKDLQGWMRRSENDSSRAGLIELIAKTETFGAAVVMASLEKSATSALIKAFDEYAEELQALPAERQAELAGLATGLFNMDELRTQLSQDERNTFRWLVEKSATGQLLKIEAYIAAKNIEDLAIEPGNLLREVGETLKTGLIFDHEKTMAAFENIVFIGEAAVRSGEIKAQTDCFAEQAFRYVIDDAMPADEFAFAVSVLQSETLPPNYDLSSAGRSMYRVLREVKDRSRQLNAFEELISHVHAEVDLKSNLSVTIPLFHQIIRGQSGGFGAAILEWSRGRDGVALYPNLARQVELAAMLTTPRDSEEWPAARERLTAVFESGDLTDSARANLAQMVFRLDSRSVGGKLMQIAVAQLPTLWAAYGMDVDPALESQAVRAVQEQRRYTEKAIYKADNWNDIETQLLDGYVAAFHDEESRAVRIRRDRIDSSFLRELLTLSLRQKRFPIAQRIIDEHGKEFRDLLSIFYELVRSGADELAGKMLRTEWETLLRNDSRSLYFDAELASRLKPFTEEFETDQEWLRWIGRYLIERARDVSSSHREYEPAEGFPSQSERILKLSETLPVDDFPDVNALRAVLSGMADFPEAIASRNAALIRAAEGITIDSIELQKDAAQKKMLERMYLASLKQSVVEGDLGRYPSEISKVMAMSDTKKKDRWAQAFQRDVTELLDRNLDIPAQSLSALIDAVLKLPPGESRRSSSNILIEKIIERSLMQYFTDNDKAALRVRFSDLDDHSHEQLSKVWARSHYNIRGTLNRKLTTRRLSSRPPPGTRIGSSDYMRRVADLTVDDLGLRSYADILTARFLDAGDISQLETKPEGLVGMAVNLMGSDGRTTAEQRAILDKATELVEAGLQSEEGWFKSYDNGWPPRSEIFQEFMKRSRAAAPDIALFVDVMWNETPADIAVSWSHLYGQKSRAEVMWRNVSNAAKGDPSEIQLFEAFLDEFREQLPTDQSTWGNLAVLRPILYETCRLWQDRPEDLAAIVNHADTMKGDPLAREFGLAARSWWASHWTPPIVDIQDPNAWADVALETLNGELPPNLRTELHHFYLYRAEHNCPEELRWKIVTDEADLLKTDVAINGYELGMVLNFFRDFERDDRWIKLAEKYIEGWKYRNRFRGRPASEGIDYVPVSVATTNMLDLYMALGNDRQTTKFIESYATILEGDSVYLPLLIRGGLHEKAAEFLTRKIDEINLVDSRQSEYPSIHQLYFDKQLENQLAAFSETLKADEERFFAELVASSVSDPRSGERLVTIDNKERQKRIVDLAGKFDSIKFSSVARSKRALQLLCQNWEAVAKLEPMLSEKFGNTKFETVPETGNSSAAIDPVLQPLVAFAVAKVHQADAKPIQELTARMGATSIGANAWGRHRCLDRLGHYFIDMILREFQSMNKEQLRAVFEGLNTYIDTIEDHKNYRTYNRAYMLQSIVADQLGANEELAKWRAGLNDDERERLESAFRQAQENGDSMTRYLFRGNPRGIEKSKAVLRADPWWEGD